jgi:hypothetical protein
MAIKRVQPVDNTFFDCGAPNDAPDRSIDIRELRNGFQDTEFVMMLVLLNM